MKITHIIIFIPDATWLTAGIALTYGLALGLLTNMLLRAWAADALVRSLRAQ